MVVGHDPFAEFLGIGQDVSAGAGEFEVFSLFNAAICTAVTDHDLTVERARWEGIGRARILPAAGLQFRRSRATQGVAEVSRVNDLALAEVLQCECFAQERSRGL